jgi:hypothetical protein
MIGKIPGLTIFILQALCVVAIALASRVIDILELASR